MIEERDPLRELRLEELRREIQKGIDSGMATPLSIEKIKARGRERLAAQQVGKLKAKRSRRGYKARPAWVTTASLAT